MPRGPTHKSMLANLGLQDQSTFMLPQIKLIPRVRPLKPKPPPSQTKRNQWKSFPAHLELQPVELGSKMSSDRSLSPV